MTLLDSLLAGRARNSSETFAADVSSPSAPSASPWSGVLSTSLWKLDRKLEIEVPWSVNTIFLVPGPQLALRLEIEGIARGRIWSTGEVLDLFLTGVTPEDARPRCPRIRAWSRALYDAVRERQR